MSGCDNFDFEAPQDEFSFWEGLRGADGTTFYPHVSAEGVLSWTNDGGKPNPEPVNIKGADGKSAYAAAQEAGFTGTEAEFNAYLAGVGDLTEEVAQHQTAINDLTDLVDRKAGMLVDTASGAIASFVPDATIPDLLGVTVDVEPVQDLHGYDHPWPGGGGKNKLDAESTFTDPKATVTIKTLTLKPNTQYTASTNHPIGSGTVAAALLADMTETLTTRTCGFWNDTPRTKTTDANGQLRIVYRLVDSETAETFLSYNYQLEEGSTATAYAPYSNECPISGRDAVGIEATGENLLDPSTLINASLNTSNGAIITGTANRLCVYKLPVPENSTITASIQRPYQFGSACFYDLQGNYISSQGLSNWAYDQYTYNIPDGAHFFTVVVRQDNNANLSPSDVQLKIEIGSTATVYEPYQGNTYAITLGQTVYGCKLTIAEDGSVTALVDRALIVADGVNVKCTGGYAAGAQRVPGINIASQKGDFEKRNLIVANYLAYANYPQDVRNSIGMFSNGDWIALHINDIKGIGSGTPYSTDAELQAAANAYLQENPLQICYVLATPITITLDPVQIATIAGQTNNVWADAGDVSVEFAADLKAYIDSKIADAVAALS